MPYVCDACERPSSGVVKMIDPATQTPTGTFCLPCYLERRPARKKPKQCRRCGALIERDGFNAPSCGGHPVNVCAACHSKAGAKATAARRRVEE